MKRVIILFLAFLFVSQSNFAQNCWPSLWTRGLTQHHYTYIISWPSDFGQMFNGQTLSYNQIQSNISSCVASAFSAWGNATNITVTDTTSNPNFTVDFEDLGGRAGTCSGNFIEFDLSSPFEFTNIDNGHFYFLTVALHEIGNLFVGGDIHNQDDAYSAMHSTDLGRIITALSSCDAQGMYALYDPYHSITVNCSFDNGDISVDGTRYNNVSLSGLNFSWREWSFPHTLQAYEKYIWDEGRQNYYWMRFYNWQDPNFNTHSDNPYYIPVSDGTYKANFLHECNIVFQNSFCDAGNGSIINVNGTQYNSPTQSFPVKEIYFSITGTAVDQTINGIHYSFDHWSDNGGTNPVHDFYPTDHHTYTAYFKGTPVNDGKYLHNDLNYGQPITLRWTDNPNANVTQYQIWRNKKGGPGPVLIATIAKGVQTYTDGDYLLDPSYNHDLLWYDAREYYSCDGTYSAPDWLAIYGEIAPKVALTLNNNINTSEIKDYSLTCFPNPFNPSTKINFALPEDQPLKLIIYDVLGRVVKELLNYYVPKGSYIVVWDGTNNAGVKVNSGIYFYSLQTPKKTIIEKMILAK